MNGPDSKSSRPITTRLRNEDADRLRAIADYYGIGVSELMRRCVQAALNGRTL